MREPLQLSDCICPSLHTSHSSVSRIRLQRLNLASCRLPCISASPPAAHSPARVTSPAPATVTADSEPAPPPPPLPPKSSINVYQLSFGTVCGICAGVFVKKGAKAVAFFLGGVFVLCQVRSSSIAHPTRATANGSLYTVSRHYEHNHRQLGNSLLPIREDILHAGRSGRRSETADGDVALELVRSFLDGGLPAKGDVPGRICAGIESGLNDNGERCNQAQFPQSLGYPCVFVYCSIGLYQSS